MLGTNAIKNVDRFLIGLIVALFIVFVLSFNNQKAESIGASLPMGGQISVVFPCNTGMNYQTITAVPGSWMDLPVSPFGHPVVKHPAQNVSGIYSTFYEPCLLGFPPIPSGPGGLRIIYSGTSL